MARHLSDEDLEYLSLLLETRILDKIQRLEHMMSTFDEAVARLQGSANVIVQEVADLKAATDTTAAEAAINAVSDQLDAAAPPAPPAPEPTP